MTIAVCKFKNFFRGNMPPNPPESFLVLTLLKIYLPKKYMLEKVTKIGALSLKKFSIRPWHETFSKGLFMPVSGSKRFCIWLTFNLIHNYIPPTKTFWIRSCIQCMVKCRSHSSPPVLTQNVILPPHCKILATLVVWCMV